MCNIYIFILKTGLFDIIYDTIDMFFIYQSTPGDPHRTRHNIEYLPLLPSLIIALAFGKSLLVVNNVKTDLISSL